MSSRILYCPVKYAALATRSKFLINSIYKIVISVFKVGVQYPAPGFGNTRFELPLQCFSMHLHSFCFFEIK